MLALQNGARTGRVLFVAELVLVANGRLHVEQRLSCSAWLQDIALCKNDCGEGALALVRKTETPSLSMVIGRTPRSDGEGFHQGLRLGACSSFSQFGNPVVSPPFVSKFRFDALLDLLDQSHNQ